jgi:hypothetical protein
MDVVGWKKRGNKSMSEGSRECDSNYVDSLDIIEDYSARVLGFAICPCLL